MRIARSESSCDPSNAAQYPLKIKAAEIGMEVLAALLDIDPIKDDQLWDTLIAAGEKMQPGEPISELIKVVGQMEPHGSTVARRLRVTGITSWPIWSSKTSSIIDDLNDPDARLVVADLGSLDTEVERECVSLGVLRHLWAHRHDRRPTLIVVDEAHNICPRSPQSEASARATELVTAIAAEGRKFGLHLLLATQRPGKIPDDVLTQCDNLMLMRMNSTNDAAQLTSAFSHVPEQLILSASSFSMGNALIAGPIASIPCFIQVEGRLTEEGGADIPQTWAQRG
jgi:hypothetical protein